MLGLLSRDDIFISYSRKDAGNYAAGLADKLTEKGFSCFLDKLGTEPNTDLPKSLKKKIKNCSIFVLVGTPAAADSEFVGQEIREFLPTKRTIVPIDFLASIVTSRWYGLIPGLAIEVEAEQEALSSGNPSLNVIGRIEKSFRYTRRNERMRRTFIFSMSLFLLLLAASIVAGYSAKTNIVEARKQGIVAQEKTKDAETAAEVAKVKEAEAAAATKNALDQESKALLAEAETGKALARQAIAEKRAIRQEEIASAQEHIAISREQASTAIQRLAINPESSVLLAGKAVTDSPTIQAEDALRQALFESHVRIIMRGHKNGVSSAVFDHSGQFVLTTSKDETADVWEAKTGNLLARLQGHGELSSPSFSPDDRFVIAASSDGTAELWEWQRQSLRESPKILAGPPIPSGPITRCSNGCEVRSAAFSPDGKYAVTAGDDAIIWVWDTATGGFFKSLVCDDGNNAQCGHRASINQVAFSPDGKYIVSAGQDNQVLLWDWESKTRSNNPSIFALPGPVSCVSFDASGRLLLTAAGQEFQSSVLGPAMIGVSQGIATVWDVQTGKALAVLSGHLDNINHAAFSVDGEYVVTASDDNTARVWNWKSDELRLYPAVLNGHTDAVTYAEFSDDGRFVITASKDGTARVWKPEIGREAANRRRALSYPPSLAILRGHTGTIWTARFSPEGLSILTASEDQTARIWSPTVERVIASLPIQRLNIQNVAFSPDDKFVATTSHGNLPIRIWELAAIGSSSAPTELRAPYSTSYRHASFSPDGKFVAAASGGLDSTQPNQVLLWDWKSPTASSSPIIIQGGKSLINSVAFSPDTFGKYVVTASGVLTARADNSNADNTIRVYDWKSPIGRVAPMIELRGHEQPVKSASFSHDGKYLVSASLDGTVRIWNWQSGSEASTPIVLRGYTASIFYQASFSPDDKYIVAAGGDFGAATLWDWRTSQGRTHPMLLLGHTGNVNVASFSPDGQLIMTSSTDGTIRLWQTNTGQSLAIISGISLSDAESASFSSDGKLIVAADGRAARIFICEECSKIEDLIRLIPKRISLQERVPGNFGRSSR